MGFVELREQVSSSLDIGRTLCPADETDWMNADVRLYFPSGMNMPNDRVIGYGLICPD